jgi:hypothetical protein
VVSNLSANNAMNADSEKRRSFAAPLFTASYGDRLDRRWNRA